MSEDCDDHRATVHPGAQELCNGMDENCDGIVDNGGFGPGAGTRGEAAAWYADWDGDGFGDASQEQWACDRPFVGATTLGGDCDDRHALVFPGAPEVCGSRDFNCDGQSAPACDPSDYPPPGDETPPEEEG